MHPQKLITYAGLTLDVSDIKCIKWPALNTEGYGYIVKIELKTRYGYILHPGTETWEKQAYHDVVEIAFDQVDGALNFCQGWKEVWQDQLI